VLANGESCEKKNGTKGLNLSKKNKDTTRRGKKEKSNGAPASASPKKTRRRTSRRPGVRKSNGQVWPGTRGEKWNNSKKKTCRERRGENWRVEKQIGSSKKKYQGRGLLAFLGGTGNKKVWGGVVCRVLKKRI